MRRLFAGLALGVVSLIGGAAALQLSGNSLKAVAWVLQPQHDWDAGRTAAAPDYAAAESWAARPDKVSLALRAPHGVVNGNEAHAVDVFFIHPTGYLNRGEWNSPLNPHSRTEENTQWMMANQASVFSGCCSVYAPRYREASIFRYFTAKPDIITQAMDLAYGDVERAFQHFLAQHNHGRPFIIASHSQGTDHGFRLLQNQIDGTPLAKRLVAAYLIGRAVTDGDVAKLKTVTVCDSPAQVGCLVHWAAFGEGGGNDFVVDGKLVCVNPLTWRRDGGAAAASLHKGGVPVSGKFSVKLWGDDSPQGMIFEPLSAPVVKHTGARCERGLLLVDDQRGTAFDGLGVGRSRNYHGLDYPLFHMDIRENANLRIASFLAAPPP